jgi:hypothetical protein
VITLAWRRRFDREAPTLPRIPTATMCAARGCPNTTLGPDVWWCSPGCQETWTRAHNRTYDLEAA